MYFQEMTSRMMLTFSIFVLKSSYAHTFMSNAKVKLKVVSMVFMFGLYAKERLYTEMSEPYGTVCDDCGQRQIGDIIFHDLFCYDVYIVSAPCPQNARQSEVDDFMAEHIVKPLEDQGFNCYHGSRNITGGEFIIQAMSYPITIIPTTIVPVYKDKTFSSLRNLLLRPDYLDRIVLLSFDSSKADPILISKTSYSMSVNDVRLLQKIIQTIERNRRQISLLERKIKYEMKNEPESTLSSNASEIYRHTLIKKPDIRLSSQIVTRNVSFSCEEISAICSKFPKMGNDILMEDLKCTASPDVLLSHCHHHDKKISHQAAKLLEKCIEKDISKFCRNTSLQRFEKEVRFLAEKEYTTRCEISNEFVKLYFWIIAATYFRIYKYNDTDLKAHMKSLTLKKNKTSPKPFDKLYQLSYLKLTASLLTKIKTWPNQLDKNAVRIQMLENCMYLVNHKDFGTGENMKALAATVKHLKALPWDIKHIFLVLVTEKIFAQKSTEYGIRFFADICALLQNKHTGIFLDLVERTTEYIREHYTKGALGACLKVLEIILDWLKVKRRKQEKWMSILKHFFKKLVYHPSSEVRTIISPLLFSEDLKGIAISQLGCTCIRVCDDLVERCIREKLLSICPDMIFKGHGQAMLNTFTLETTTSTGDALVCMLRQKTLNDILQTNYTDDAYESFQEISTAVARCQGHDNIVHLLNMSPSGVPPFYMVEHGKPLLHFLHDKENQLTWSEITNILIEITNAVVHCHRNFVVLRDITPASFEVFPGVNGSFQVKLSSFLYAKCTLNEEAVDPTHEYIEDYDFLYFQGDYKEPVAAYFSAPETLSSRMFSKFTEIWMLAATFYSILLYGRQPFQELAHLSASQFVNEIISCHKPNIPGSISPDLWTTLSANLGFVADKRMVIGALLQELESYKDNLGPKKDTIYAVKSVCAYINPADIQRGYLNINGKFIHEKKEDTSRRIYHDGCKRNDRLHETVSYKMSLSTRKKITTLNHPNILQVMEILHGSYTTKLVYYPFGDYTHTLNSIEVNISMDKLLSYFDQLTSAMQELHFHNILHCDLRCCHVYVNPCEGTLKVGHFGRAVSLEGKQANPYAYKMMPHDAEKWSAPEVKHKGIYSQASDIYNLASVLWEALNTQDFMHRLNPDHRLRKMLP
ncbi:uncharacterized protein LOC128468238 [Spea bombifrons]|uniref:uncharacterized protein LOC128468238 n=1 Tax=Spea bombifrons TaxID=233779 RepID=UPI002349E596|nr:uncharacterized protein LOC128468238 [Spea bombifrons]